MAWSKVSNAHKKPLKWWLHKILCEIGWIIRFKDNYKMYYIHLVKCEELGFNLYGELYKSLYEIEINLNKTNS